jgi:hypothetical protein
MPVFKDYSPAAHGEPSTVNTNPATPAQGQFIKRLVEEREVTGDLLTQVEAARAAWVEGTYTRPFASALIDLLKRAPYKSKPSVEVGIYVVNGVYYKVVPNQEGTALYAKTWVAETQSWLYVGAPHRVGLKPEHKTTAEQAAEFGHVTGQCVFCSRLLTDERSLAVGYGPVCASKNGLAWGEEG